MTIIRKQGNWMAAVVGNELLMMSPAHENYIGLNEVGARIWSLLDSPVTIEDICARLADEFDVGPDVARSETEAFLADLLKHDAIAFDHTETA